MTNDHTTTIPKINCAMQQDCRRADYMRALFRFLREHRVEEVALRQDYVTGVLGWALPAKSCGGECEAAYSHL